MSDQQVTSKISNSEPRIEIVSDTKNQRKKNMLSEIRFNEKEVLRDDLFTARSKNLWEGWVQRQKNVPYWQISNWR